MTNSNKILTVSYGTFACTLEGFDDSLETMKAVAEYFRDLAAEDRFFGSEPVQVDAAALTKIVQDASASDVDIDTKDNHIKLRTVDAENASPERSELATGAADTAAAAAAAAAGVAAATVLNDANEDDADEVVHRDDTDAKDTDSTTPADATSTDEVISEDDGSVAETPEQESPEQEEAPAAELKVADELSESEPSDEIENNTDNVATVEEITAQSVADKLQRIRAAEEQNAALDSSEQQENESELEAETQNVEAENVVAEARNDIEDALEEDDNLLADKKSSEPEVDELSKLLNRLDEAADAEAKNDAALEAEENKSGFVGEDEFELVENLFDDDKANAASAAAAAKRTVALSTAKPDNKIAETDSTAPHGQTKDVPSNADAAKKDDGVLVLGAADVRAAPTPDRAKTRQLSRELLPSLDETEGSDVNRLLAKADTQMGEPENATRRRAFSHLRAAVAAKKADSSIGGNGEKAGNAYRSDLADASPVPPQSRDDSAKEVVADKAPSAKPAAATAHASPLKLVADPDDASPAKATMPTDAVGFEEFASEFGASSLSQRLEAAAAYISFIECAENFSRTKLMKVATQGSPQEFSREDGLRSFGTLLREGKLQKLPGGLFSVSEDTEYRPKKRAS